MSLKNTARKTLRGGGGKHPCGLGLKKEPLKAQIWEMIED